MTSPVKSAHVSPIAPSDESASCGPELVDHYQSIRQLSEQLCQPLVLEDYGLQAMASTSPAKWHLAHTSWFFETFILQPYCPDYQVFDSRFEALFNSYYNGIGRPYPRSQRGFLSRPTVEEVYHYRRHVDGAMLNLLAQSSPQNSREINQRSLLGCHHEQQHQELFFTDLKYCWFQNPLYPVYCGESLATAAPVKPLQWQSVNSGLYEIGHGEPDTFCFDNEIPAHPVYVGDYRIADRLVSNGEYAEFMRSGGYSRAELWLADGWAELQGRASQGAPLSPLYWVEVDGGWMEYTLHGLVPVDPHRPVAHLSAYEADAYARWARCRLPTEFEWEVSAGFATTDDAGQFLDDNLVHPVFSDADVPLDNCLGRLWQWTSSAYSPYPGFKAAEGAVGEYNGKFMANQLVLRGGSCATSRTHYRHSYRNFFYARDQWQFTGLRLAQDG